MGWKDGSVGKPTDYSSKELKFNSNHPHEGWKPFIAPCSGDLTASPSDLHWQQYTHKHVPACTHTEKTLILLAREVLAWGVLWEESRKWALRRWDS